MAIYKRGKVYWYEFEFNGERIRESTKQGNDKVARQMESAHRTALAKGEVGIREKKAAPTLKNFLDEYLPYMQEKHKAKANTVSFYGRGVKMLLASEMAGLRLDEITSQHTVRYTAANSQWSASHINCALRTLSIVLRLAVEWGKLAFAPKVKVAAGEKTRDRVLSTEEQIAYLDACTGDWKDIATVMLNTGMRPGEVRGLAWEGIDFGTRTISISEGKTENATRRLPMLDAVYNGLLARWEAQGKPNAGWVFPSPMATKTAHVTQGYDGHTAALKASGVAPFVPYTMRHTALTMLGTAGVDLFTLKTIAGHSSIRMTQRYVHPQEQSVRNAFELLATPKTPHIVKTPVVKGNVNRAA